MNDIGTEPQRGTQRRERLPTTDLVLGGLLLLIGGVLFVLSAQLQGGGPTDPMGPRGFPSLLALGFLASGAALLVKSVVIARRPVDSVPEAVHDDEDDSGPALRWRLVLGALVLVAYVFVLPTVGFLLSTPVFVAAMITLQGGVARRPFVAMVVGFPVVVYLLFAVVLGVPLPPGVFDPMLLLGA